MKIHCGILKDDTLQIGREVAILNNVLHPSRQMNGTYSLHHIASYLTKNMISVFTAITISNPIFTVHNKVQAKTSPVVFSSGIPIYPTRCNVTQFIYIRKLHYMFRVLLPPTIRSAYNCIYSAWHLSHRYCYLSLSRRSWNSVFRERYIWDYYVLILCTCLPRAFWSSHYVYSVNSWCQFPSRASSMNLYEWINERVICGNRRCRRGL